MSINYYPNQKQITIKRENVEKSKDNGRLYLIAYQDNLIEAMNVLSPAAFKVYVCLLFNKDSFKIEFSPEHISRLANLCKDTVRKALNQLISAGYIEVKSFNKMEFSERRMPQYHSGSMNKYDIRRKFKNMDGLEYTSGFQEMVRIYGFENAEYMWESGEDV